MGIVASDSTLVRGSFDITINGVLYTLIDYKRGAKARSESDYDKDGKFAGASHAEDCEMITGTIRKRSNRVDPPKFTAFAFDSKNWYIVNREESGSTSGIKDFSVEIWETVTGVVTIS